MKQLYTPWGRPGGAPCWNCQHERLQKVVPGERDLVVVAFDCFGPERVGVALPAELRLNDLNGLVGKLGEKQALDLLLQPAGQGDVVGVDPYAFHQVTLDEQYVAGTAG